MNSFKIISYSEPYGDETRDYNIQVSENATVGDVIKDIVSNKSEWGYIGLKSDNPKDVFGAHAFEYEHGEIYKHEEKENKPIDIDEDNFDIHTSPTDFTQDKHELYDEEFWNSISDRKVISMTGSGGWTRIDYLIEI